MSKYRVLATFKENNHDGTVYEKDGTYPKEGYKTTKKRIEELTSDKNKYKHPFLEEIKEGTEADAKKGTKETKKEAKKPKDNKKSEK